MATVDNDRYIDLGLLDAASIVPFDNTRALRRAARRNAVRDASLGLDSDYISNARVDSKAGSNYADVYNKYTPSIKRHYFSRWINERQYPITRKTNAFGGYIKL